MKHIVFLALAGLFALSGTANAQEEVPNNVFSDPILTPSLEFSAEIQADGTVKTGWNEWEEDFMWYKVIRSQDDPDPTYPEHGHIFFSTDHSITEYFDTEPPQGKTFYRICVITHSNDRFCSNVVAVDSENSATDSEKVTNNELVHFCAQVITPAKDPNTSECRSFPTPCDVPEGWENIEFCPENSKCEPGEYPAMEPQSNICDTFLSNCEIPRGWQLLPSNQTCPSSNDFPLQLMQSEAGVLLLWEAETETDNDFRIFRKELSPGEPSEFLAIADGSDTNYQDTNVAPQSEYAYRVCVLEADTCVKSSIIQEITIQITAEPEPIIPSPTFSDIQTESEVGQAVIQFADQGVINGFQDGTFQPNKNITRAELAKVAILATGNTVSPVENQQRFCDVPSNEWYAPYIDYFVVNGYANGFTGGDCPLNMKFNPHDPVLRSEAVKMVFEITGIRPINNLNDTEFKFNDIPASHWFVPYANAVAASGVFEGIISDRFRPNEPATRGEVVLFLKRAFEYASSAAAPPKIVDHFACGDYCPGDAEKYTVKIYEGVTTEDECTNWNGTLYTYFGWTETTICLAEGEKTPSAVPTQEDERSTNDQAALTTCDAINPCESGECYLLPGETVPVCVDTAIDNVCDACESGECVSLGSYPVQIRCTE